MAVTSIWPITRSVKQVVNYAVNPEKTIERAKEIMSSFHAIGNVVEYAADEIKTESRSYVTCLNCISEETAAEEFMATKKYWRKEAGRLCFHGYQSFKGNEVNAETAHKIGVELAQKLWGDDYQVVIATHCNTGHYHNHFIVNSVSFRDGRHFHNAPADYKALREASDELCRKYHISVIENPSGHGKSYGEQIAEKEDRPTYRSMIRSDIDRAIAGSVTRNEFFEFMRKAGYEFKLYKESGEALERPGLKPPGAKSYFRFYKLGPGYDLAEIDERILENLRRRDAVTEEERREIKAYRKEHPPPRCENGNASLYKVYIRYNYELRFMAKFPASVKRVPFFMREDLIKLERLDAQTRLLSKLGIKSAKELLDYRNGVMQELHSLADERSKLRTELRRYERRGDPELIEGTKEQISEITQKMREKRKEAGLCDDILTRSAQTREELEWIIDHEEPEYKHREEEKDYELFGRSGGAGREDKPGRG